MAHSLPSQIMSTCDKGMLWCFANWASTVTSGAFWIFMLLGFQVALFMATARLGNARAFGFATFVGLLGGMWLSILQLIYWWVGSAFILVGLVGIAGLILNEK